LRTEIVLIVPYNKSHYVVPPVGLGYLATSLRASGYDSIKILDCIKEQLPPSKLGRALEVLDPKMVGFQIFSADFASARESMGVAKAAVPKAVMIAGGPHVSATGTRALDEMPVLDYAFVGEAEMGLPMLVDRVVAGKKIDFHDMPGLMWRNEKGSHSSPRTYIKDLDGLGFPAWDLMPPDSYPDAPQGAFYQQFPIAPIATSRGCPYSCAFCGSPVNMGKQLRFRSLPHVFAEMELLRSTYRVKEFHFIDDMFNMSKKRVMDFCHMLEQKRWGISYSFPNGLRLNTLDREMLIAMKKTGAYAFTVGIESGSQRVLDLMNKHLTVDLIKEKVNLIDDVGLEPSGFFLLGFPGETKEEMRMTLDLAKSLPLKRAHFSNFLPLPGTEATNRLLESGEIQNPDWTTLCYSKVPYVPMGMTREDLKAFQRRAFLEFHLRPKILVKLLSEIKSPFHLLSVIRRARDYLFSR
jgi:anaerobic magnesium-protoporphyrin IX monomethyl ester cyclase